MFLSDVWFGYFLFYFVVHMLFHFLLPRFVCFPTLFVPRLCFLLILCWSHLSPSSVFYLCLPDLFSFTIVDFWFVAWVLTACPLLFFISLPTFVVWIQFFFWGGGEERISLFLPSDFISFINLLLLSIWLSLCLHFGLFFVCNCDRGILTNKTIQQVLAFDL